MNMGLELNTAFQCSISNNVLNRNEFTVEMDSDTDFVCAKNLNLTVKSFVFQKKKTLSKCYTINTFQEKSHNHSH